MEDDISAHGHVEDSVEPCSSCGARLSPMPEFECHGCYECGSCGLVVCLPFPKNVQEQYAAPYFAERREQDAPGVWAKVEAFRPLAARLRRVLGPGARVLEVGAAVGALIRAMRDEGLDAVGLELSEDAVRTADEVLGVKLLTGSAEVHDLPPDNDAIVALHVLEHLHLPREFLADVHRSLRNRGMLVIEVPDFGAPLRERAGVRWPYFRPGEHLYHFTESSLGDLLTSSGFRVRKFERYGGYGLLATHRRGAEETISGVRLCLFRIRGVAYRFPGAQRSIRALNNALGYQLLRKHHHIRVWAERVE